MGDARPERVELGGAWGDDVRIRLRPGRQDSGVKLYVTDHLESGPRELMANTGFFRYPGLFTELAACLDDLNVPALRVCIVPLSVGIEAVSFAIACLENGVAKRKKISIAGFDISRKATELAREGRYPSLFFPDEISKYDDYLQADGEDYVTVGEDVRRNLEVLPATDILTFEPEQPYDLVICLNLFMHLPEEARPELLDRLAAMTAPGGILCLNNNQEWPEELAPHFKRLTAPDGGFRSLENDFTSGGNGQARFAVTDAMAMVLEKR